MHLAFAVHTRCFRVWCAPRFPITHDLCTSGLPGILSHHLLVPVSCFESLVFPAFLFPEDPRCNTVRRTPGPLASLISSTFCSILQHIVFLSYDMIGRSVSSPSRTDATNLWQCLASQHRQSTAHGAKRAYTPGAALREADLDISLSSVRQTIRMCKSQEKGQILVRSSVFPENAALFTTSHVAAPVRAQVEAQAILSGHFAPEARLIERERCHLLRVSRTPRYEAFRHLEMDGLVTNIPYNGIIVITTSEEAQEVYKVRAVGEGRAGRLCAPNISRPHQERHSRLLWSRSKRPSVYIICQRWPLQKHRSTTYCSLAAGITQPVCFSAPCTTGSLHYALSHWLSQGMLRQTSQRHARFSRRS